MTKEERHDLMLMVNHRQSRYPFFITDEVEKIERTEPELTLEQIGEELAKEDRAKQDLLTKVRKG